MLDKKIKYTDFLGNEREETFHFHISDAKLAEWELSRSGGLTAYITKIAETQDVPKLIELYKELIAMSIGEISPDGRRFMQSEEITKNFTETNAYEVLFMELATSDKAGADFVSGLVSDKLKKALAENNNGVHNGISPNHPALKH